MARKYDERFDELTGLVRKVVGRVDEMHLEMRDMRQEMRSEAVENGLRFERLESSLQVTAGRQNDVIPKVIEIQKSVNRISETQTEQSFKIVELLNRVDDVDRGLKRLDERTVEMESEVNEVRRIVMSLIDPILDGKTLWANISHIEERLARLEEKIS